MDQFDYFVLVLSRVQSFLPQMQTANEQLRQQDASKLDIENVQEDDGQYIEMVRQNIYKQTRNGQDIVVIPKIINNFKHLFFLLESWSWSFRTKKEKRRK